MLPILRRLYARPLTAPADWRSRDITKLALRRIVELAPNEGRQLILQEIKKSRPRFRMDILGLLPDTTIPALDTTLADNLEHPGEPVANDPFAGDRDFQIVPQLIARYATAAILPRVKSYYGDPSRGWACDTQAALLAYFLRTDPAYGAAMLQKAMAKRQDTGCYHTVLEDVARLRMNPDVEKTALAHLNDPDAEVAASAANVLGRYGSPEVEAALWQSLRQWHEKWQGRAEELRFRPGAENPLTEQTRLESALLHALAQGKSWLADKTKLQRLRDLAVTANARQEMESLLHRWNDRILLSYLPGELGRWQVAQYEMQSIEALQSKLMQFPRGTVFIWPDYSVIDPATQTTLVELQAFLQQRGMTLEVPARRKPE